MGVAGSEESVEVGGRVGMGCDYSGVNDKPSTSLSPSLHSTVPLVDLKYRGLG